VITLIHGPAELLRAEALARIRAGISDDPSLVELNTAVLDGRQATLADLEFACGTLPFLAERRLVVVERMLVRLSAPPKVRTGPGPGAAESGPDAPSGAGAEGSAVVPTQGTHQTKALLAFFDRVSETAELVLVEEETITAGAVLRRLIELQREGRAKILVCEKPRRGDLPGWIKARARQRNVELDSAAVADLAEFVGDDLRQLDQELIKLRDYAGGKSTVGQAAVRQLVPATRAANVFDMVDALASGNIGQAGRLLRHALDLDGEEPLGLLSLLGRRYRQLAQAKALQMGSSRADDAAKALGVADWQARRLLEQADRLSREQIRRTMEHLVAADEAIKTGKCSDREAMDILLAELATDAKG
jgi:DNA polymerase III subunit delta